MIVESIKGVEEGFLCFGLSLKKLNIVDEQNVDVAVAGLEGGSAVIRNRIDEVVREFLGAHVFHADGGIQALRVVPNGMQ